METVESSEAIVLLIVIAMIGILIFCAIDLVFYKLFKRKPKKNKKVEKSIDEEVENGKIDMIDKELAELDKIEEEMVKRK